MSLIRNFGKSNKSLMKSEGSVNGDSGVSPLKSFALPNKESKLEDKILDAKNSNGQFQYATVTGFPKETKNKMLDRLISSRPVLSSTELSLDDLPVVDLKERKLEVSVATILGKNLTKMNNFIHLEELRYCFAGTQGFFTNYAKVVIGIKDERLLNDQIARSVSLQSNTPGMAMMGLDHYVHKIDVGKIKLFIHCENSAFENGTIWGSLQTSIKFSHSMAAKPVALNPTLGVLELPQSAMKKFKENPYYMDLTFDPEDLKSMQEMYKKGKIIDRSIPVEKQREKNLGSSEAGSLEEERIDLTKFDKLDHWRRGNHGYEKVKPFEETSDVFSETSDEKRIREETAKNTGVNVKGKGKETADEDYKGENETEIAEGLNSNQVVKPILKTRFEALDDY